MRYHFTPTRIASIQQTDNTKCWQRCGDIGTIILCWWKCKVAQLLWKAAWQFLERVHIELPYDPAIPFLNIYPREMKTYVQTKFYTDVYDSVTHNSPKVETTQVYIS